MNQDTVNTNCPECDRKVRVAFPECIDDTNIECTIYSDCIIRKNL